MTPWTAVDGHQHFWDPAIFPARSVSPDREVQEQAFLPAQLAPELVGAGVGRTVAIQALPQTPEHNRWLFDTAAGAGFVAGVVAWADLTRPGELPETLDQLRARPLFCGLRHIAELEEDDWLARKEVLASLRELARREIPFDLAVGTGQLRQALRLAGEVPNLYLALDHMGKPDISGKGTDEWTRLISEIGRRPRVFCKVSGIAGRGAGRDRWTAGDLKPFFNRCLEAFGPDRLVFGSDWPVCNLAGGYRKVWEALNANLADLAEADRQKILGENASRFYRLRPVRQRSG